MTVTEAPAAAPAETAPEARSEPRGVVAVLGSGNHLTIGRLWLAGAALFLLLTVVAGVLLGVERITLDDLEILGNDGAAQFFSLYRVGITFLVVLPLFLGLATAIVPLQVGASTIAFPGRPRRRCGPGSPAASCSSSATASTVVPAAPTPTAWRCGSWPSASWSWPCCSARSASSRR